MMESSIFCWNDLCPQPPVVLIEPRISRTFCVSCRKVVMEVVHNRRSWLPESLVDRSPQLSAVCGRVGPSPSHQVPWWDLGRSHSGEHREQISQVWRGLVLKRLYFVHEDLVDSQRRCDLSSRYSVLSNICQLGSCWHLGWGHSHTPQDSATLLCPFNTSSPHYLDNWSIPTHFTCSLGRREREPRGKGGGSTYGCSADWVQPPTYFTQTPD